MKSYGLWIPVAVLVPLCLFLGTRYEPRPESKPQAPQSALLGRPAPAFRLSDLNGVVVDSAQLAGKPYVVNFWATWCLPCTAEHGFLQTAAESVRERVRFVGVVYQDDPKAARDYLKKRGSSYPHLLDPDSRVAKSFGVTGVPETYFVDAQGVVNAAYIGPITPAALAAELEQFAPQGPSEK
jgi:cytochrome c biogenesis protein CcmG/thiol:disulfide interchange protein DsbE